LIISPELFEMIDYTTTVSDFTDLDPLNMYQRLKNVEEPRVGKSDELLSQKVSSPYIHGVSSHPASVPEPTRVYKPLVSAPMKSNWVTVFGEICVTSGHTVDIPDCTGAEETRYVPCCKRMSPI
jgi:hypothetical protein